MVILEVAALIAGVLVAVALLAPLLARVYREYLKWLNIIDEGRDDELQR